MAELFLLIQNGERAGERLVVDEITEIGREVEGAGCLEHDEALSRRHAVLSRTGDGGLSVEDLGSSNGTYVSGRRVTKSTRLLPDDVLEVGNTRLVVCSDGQRPGDEAAPSDPSAADDSRESRSTGMAVIHNQRRIDIPPAGMTIGRLPDNDLVISSHEASRHHAWIVMEEGRHMVADLQTPNGTYLNGERLLGEARWLRSGDTIVVGGEPIRYLTGSETRLGIVPPTATADARRVRFAGERIGIGRDSTNDVVLEAPTISRFHAEVVRVDDRVELRDLGSRNGTSVDGRLVTREPLSPGSEIGVGPFRLIFDGLEFHQRDDTGALRLDAYDISVDVKGRTILDRASLSVQPGELVVAIGESGSGKTTLMRVLAGVSRPSHGRVLINGEPLEARLTDIGYLPQDEIVHPRLTVLESLRHSARLRLPPDSSRAEIEDAVARALAETSLEQHAATRIGALSGGQRKRVGLATELLSRPGLLFLDEPTTGLDPGLETRMMDVFRDLASVGSHALFVVTHATRNLEVADRMCVLGRGGHLCFVGPPRDAMAFFDVSSYDDIYLALDRRSAAEWRQAFESTFDQPPEQEQATADISANRRRIPTRRRTGWLQAGVLASRYLKVFLRDYRNVLILTLQVPLIGLAMALLFKPDVFAPDRAHASSAAQLVFLLVVTTIWLGTIASAREIIKERAVFERERAVGVGIAPYVASKVSVLVPLVAFQAALLLAVVAAVRPLHESAATYEVLFGALLLTGVAAVSMGLLISALVRTEEQAMALIPIAMIAQLLFAGALVTVRDMGGVLAALSTFVFSRWAFGGAGAIIDMNERIARDASFAKISPYAGSFFGMAAGLTYAILAVFALVLLLLVALSLRRRVA